MLDYFWDMYTHTTNYLIIIITILQECSHLKSKSMVVCWSWWLISKYIYLAILIAIDINLIIKNDKTINESVREISGKVVLVNLQCLWFYRCQGQSRRLAGRLHHLEKYQYKKLQSKIWWLGLQIWWILSIYFSQVVTFSIYCDRIHWSEKKSSN